MSINEFARRVTEREGGAKSLSIAQVKEVLRIVNEMTNGLLYAIVKWCK